MEQKSLFDFLGIEPVDAEAAKQSKPAVKNQKGSGNSKKDGKKDAVEFPVKVVTAYADTVSYQASDFQGPDVTAKDVFEKFTSENPSFPRDLCSFSAKDKGTVAVFVKQSHASDKVTVRANGQTKYLLGGTALDLSAFMTDTECEVEADTLIKAFQKEYPEYGPVKMCYSATENTVVPYFAADGLHGSVKLPVDVAFWNHEGFTVTVADLGHHDEEGTEDVPDGANEEGEAEGEETAEKKPSGQSISDRQLLEIVEAHYPGFKGMLRLLYSKGTGSIVVSIKEDAGTAATAQRKEVLFPTDAEVSLYVHIRFRLSPDMFGGKAEITEAEFRKFLEERYPEFSPERTIILYDEKKRLIMPGLKSSSKGALCRAGTEEEEEGLKASPFPFIREYGDGSSYRVESTPAADFKICMEGDGSRNAVKFKLPKIPLSLIVAAREFFQEVYAKMGTEALLQLFYDGQGQSYFWHLPPQEASEGSVDAARSIWMEQKFLLVADFHSHGAYRAYWSAQDCADEKGTRFYGVMGGFAGGGTYSECFRAGCGGYFGGLDGHDIIDYEDLDYGMVERTVGSLAARAFCIAAGRKACPEAAF